MADAPKENETPIQAIQETKEAVAESASGLSQRLTDWFASQEWLNEALAPTASHLALLLGLLAAAWLLYAIFRPLVLRWVKFVISRTSFEWDNQLLGHGVFRWLTHLLPGLLVYLLSPGLFESAPLLAGVLKMASAIYLLISSYFVIDSLTNAIQGILGQTRIASHLNLTSIAQVVKLVAALVIFLLCIAVLLQKPVFAILSGLGILASVLMLVFKDVILGFVAGIQLATNRMLSIGDWLEMPSHNADGDVEEIGLTTVKVRNWDKTVTTIPTHALISQSFKNWRGMSESGGRRIKRCILIDTNTIRLCDEEMLERFREIEHISEYLSEKEMAIESANETLSSEHAQNRVNGRRLTNIGTFRAYIEAYLRNHPDINQDMTLLVRQMEPTGKGLPIQVYCFSSIKEWAAYESIQADIFDHLFAVAPEFGLRVFQEPSGSDFRQWVEEASES